MFLLLMSFFSFQQRFGDEYRQLKGFTISPTEHMMIEYEGIPEVRSVRGRIVEASSGVGLPNAIFELRKEDPDDRVRGVSTKESGEFRLRSVREGIYVFKVTKDGFKSVFGKLKVSKKSPPSNMLIFKLYQGV